MSRSRYKESSPLTFRVRAHRGMAAMAARAIWKGSISFGLVNIPIQVFSATQKEEYTSFNQLCNKGHKIKYKKWCPVEEREVPWSEIKKGYEITKNDYVVLEKEEIENIKLKTTNTVEVKEFIESGEFDPIFIEKNYYVGPDAGKKKSETSIKAYALFVKILHETGKIAIGKVVLREKEQLVALRAYQRGLVMHQLWYLDEIRPMDEIGGLESLQKIDAKELSLGKALVDNLTTDKFDPGQYSDTYAKELEKIIEAKSKGEKVTINEVEKKTEETTDIIEALKASLKVKGKVSTSTAAKAKGKIGMAVSK
ncbi:MAG TPA: Ku protein [Nitrososphaeraceae archaeon]|nr:Ku protein [Nitrososphaeraceae archaeon]